MSPLNMDMRMVRLREVAKWPAPRLLTRPPPRSVASSATGKFVLVAVPPSLIPKAVTQGPRAAHL